MKKGTPLDAFELPILAAIFARSNMGMGYPTKKLVEQLKVNKDWRTKEYAPVILEVAVADICGRFMESEQHQGWFEQEARSWLNDLKRETCESLAQVHSGIAELYWRDPATYVDNKRYPNG